MYIQIILMISCNLFIYIFHRFNHSLLNFILGPKILHNIGLSNTNNLCFMHFLRIHVSFAYIITGLLLVQYNFTFRPRGKKSTKVRKSQNKRKESENSYQKLKRSPRDRHTKTHGNCIEIFRLAQPSLSIGRE